MIELFCYCIKLRLEMNSLSKDMHIVDSYSIESDSLILSVDDNSNEYHLYD